MRAQNKRACVNTIILLGPKASLKTANTCTSGMTGSLHQAPKRYASRRKALASFLTTVGGAPL